MDSDQVTAFAFGDGVIHFQQFGLGVGLPKGALFLARGEPARLRELLGGLARHAHEPGVLLVPGVPEAIDQDAAFQAFMDFFERVQNQLREHSNLAHVRELHYP